MRNCLLIFLVIISANIFAKSIVISDIDINCIGDVNCENIKSKFNSLKRKYTGLDHIKDMIKIYSTTEGIDKLNYQVIKNKKEIKLKFNVKPKPIIVGVEIKFLGEKISLPKILQTKINDYYDKKNVDNTVLMLKKYVINKGFPKVKITHSLRDKENGKKITIKININKPLLLKKIDIISESKVLKNILAKKLAAYYDEPFDLQNLKTEIEDIRQQYFAFGFYLLDIDINYKRLRKNYIYLYIKIKNEKQYIFNFKGNKRILTTRLKEILKESIKVYKRDLKSDYVKSLLIDEYKSNGNLETIFDIKRISYKNNLGDDVSRYDIQITENKITKLKNIRFRGNVFFNKDELIKFYYDEPFELAEEDIFDEKYFIEFRERIKKKYIEAGFVNVLIHEPVIRVNNKKHIVDVEYRIREGIRAYLSDVNIVGVDKSTKKVIKKNMINKESKAFNPIIFEEELKNIERYLQDMGYLFAEILNKNSNNIVEYLNENSQVKLNININSGDKIILDKLIVIGNNNTQKKVILREVNLERNKIIKKSELRNIQSRLLSLGLFSQVKITPVKKSVINKRTDLLISVKEKEFGTLEVATGYRTDLGLKLSSSVSYSNVFQQNVRTATKVGANKRLSYEYFDQRRSKEKRDILEGFATVNMNINYFLDTQLQYTSALTFKRQRLYAFDADINRLSNTFATDVNSFTTVSLTHQFESIKQSDATSELDQGEFQIGSITPGMTFDFRDSAINTRKGAYFDLSCEIANPTFLSQSEDDLEINYYKAISRNRFYIPMPNNYGVFATSLTMGVQKNQATETITVDDVEQTKGNIPSIKVFRLTGIDVVRGFEDDEINRVDYDEDDDGEDESVDISGLRIDDTAYMVNFKFEPRFFINDAMIFGVFYDAGRLFVDSYDTSNLRSSVGVSFKYLTPLGTLDFDYGIKLLRKEEPGGTLESPGKLHVSIGFF